MLPLPSREALYILRRAVETIVPIHSVGFVRSLDDARLSLLVFHPNGVGGYVVQRSQVPAVLRPSVEEPRQEETRWPGAKAEGVIEWLMALGNVVRVASFAVPGSEPPMRAWFGTLSPDPLTYDQMRALEAVVRESREQLGQEPSFEEANEQLRRLEETANLLPPLLHVLDVREVFDLLSVIAKRALPHDVLLLRVFSEDLKSLTTYAMSAGGANVGVPVPQVYPADLIRSWQFDIVDDLSIHPVEGRQLLVAGGHSVLRIPVWFG